MNRYHIREIKKKDKVKVWDLFTRDDTGDFRYTKTFYDEGLLVDFMAKTHEDITIDYFNGENQ